MNIESAAINILKRGIVLDNDKRYTEALVCYQEGLQILVNRIKDERDESARLYLRGKIEEYMLRAETIKKLVVKQKEMGQFHEQVHIMNDSTGHSYKSLFGRFLDEEVKYVIVEDPYIRNFHQCQNFLRLCELVVGMCPNLTNIDLVTSKDSKLDSEQSEWFNNMSTDLLKYKVTLDIKYSITLHDRQITLSTGWIIKIGRGLDFYKAPDNRFCLGVFDLDLRLCHETTVDIVHSKNIKQSYG